MLDDIGTVIISVTANQSINQSFICIHLKSNQKADDRSAFMAVKNKELYFIDRT